MKKDKAAHDEGGLRPEYDLAKLKGGVLNDAPAILRCGKHRERYRTGTKLALFAPDVRAAFPTDEAVNRALRSVMQTQNRS